MSYRVLCDGYLLHDSNLEMFSLISPKLEMEVNKAGEFTFQITHDHVYYDKIVNKKSYIEIYENGQWLWSGRPIKIKPVMNLCKTVTCEGELSFLHDSNQRLSEYHDISVEEYFTNIINKHNNDVDEFKRFTVGNVTVEDNNDSLYRYSNYEDTFDTIQDKLIDRLGGYLIVRHEDNIRYIDYVKEYPVITNQKIEFGSNIIDLSIEDSAIDTISGIIPLGYKLKEDEEETSSQSDDENQVEKRLTIESVNGGKDYILNDYAVSQIGVILGVVKFDDVTDPSNLMQKGYNELIKKIYSQMTISLSVFDRSYVDKNILALKLGATVVVNSEKHGLYNQDFMIEKISISLVDVTETKITIGITKNSLTGNVVENNNKFDTKVENIVSNYILNERVNVINPKISELSTKIDQTSEEIRSEATKEFITIDDKEEIYNYISTMISQSAEEITMTFVDKITNVENQVNVEKNNIEKYIRFSNGEIELGDTLSEFKTNITNTEIYFSQSGNKVAWISNNQLHIKEAVIEERIIMNPFVIEIDENGFVIR